MNPRLGREEHEGMANTSKPDTDWAKEALRTFWRRTFTVLATRAEQAAGDKLKQAQAYRAKLGEVR